MYEVLISMYRDIYKVDVSSVSDIEEFVSTLRELCMKLLSRNIDFMLACGMQSVLDYAVMYDKSKEMCDILYTDFLTYIEYLLNESRDFSPSSSKHRDSLKSKDKKELLVEYIPDCCVRKEVINKVRADTYLDKIGSLYNIGQSMDLFTLESGNTYIVIYGNTLCEVIRNHICSKKVEELKKFDIHLEGFRYLDINLNEILRNSVHISIVDEKIIEYYVLSVPKESIVNSKVLDKKYRIEKLSMGLIDAYTLYNMGDLSKMKTSDILGRSRKIEEELEDKNSYTYKKYIEFKDKLDSILPIINKEMLSMSLEEFLQRV